MQLLKELSEVSLQRDLAQAQVKDLLQVVGDDKSSMVSVCVLLTEESIFTSPSFLSLVSVDISPGGYGSLLPQTASAKFMGL